MPCLPKMQGLVFKRPGPVPRRYGPRYLSSADAVRGWSLRHLIEVGDGGVAAEGLFSNQAAQIDACKQRFDTDHVEATVG